MSLLGREDGVGRVRGLGVLNMFRRLISGIEHHHRVAGLQVALVVVLAAGLAGIENEYVIFSVGGGVKF